MSNMKLNTENTGYIKVINPLSNEPVIGLTQEDFSYLILANDATSTDIIVITEIGSGNYLWSHTPTILGSRKITISLELEISGVTQYFEWSLSFSVIAHDLEDVYNAIQLITPGTGSELLSVYAKENISDLPIPEADYEIWDENNLIRLHSGTDPNADGQQDFLLNPGNYNIRLRKAYWNFPIIVPITIPEGGLIETIYGDRLTPSPPPSPDLCVVYGYTIKINGEVLPEATVKATLKSPEVFLDISKIADIDNETTSDMNGYFELILIPNTQFDIPDTKYSFEVSKESYKFERDGIVPNFPSAEFKNILVLDC